MTGVRHITVAETDDGQRLDRWLKKHMSFVVAQKLIRTGQIRIDGKRAKADTRLSAGQDVRLPPVDDKPGGPDRPMKLTRSDESYIRSLILHDNGDIVALNKPGDIASQGGGGVQRHIDGLLELLKDKKDRRPKLIHRLDRETSGVLLCARAPDSVRKLGKAFMDRRARKIYLAIVVPAPAQEEGTIKAPLAKASGAYKDKMVVDDGEDSKMALTDFIILEKAGKDAAFVAFMPRTGRTHQIRVHAADVLKCPVLGDGKYGGDTPAALGNLDMSDRLHLHARRLVLPNPSGKGIIDFTAPLPPDFKKTMKALGFDSALADKQLSAYLQEG